jgi:glutamyl-tRNA reductase
MNYLVVSFNYKHCSLESREKIAFVDDEATRRFLDLFVWLEMVLEAFVINTCNRIEIVAATRDNFATYHAAIGLLSKLTEAEFDELASTALRLEDEAAVEHLFSVVSSLDSLVVGEAQITGQVKEAFRLSHANGTAGKELNRILSYAIKCAAEVRNVTNISQNPISIASVAVAQAIELMGGSLAGMTGMVVGAGEMGRLAAKHLLRAGADVLILTRNRAHAEALAEELGENVRVADFDRLRDVLNRYRLLFTATSAPEPIITSDMITNPELKRLWFDMAIPRDIDTMENEDITLYRIDDLQAISQNNHALRQEQALQAGEIVHRYREEFFRWLRALSIEPVIKRLRLQIDAVIDAEIERTIRKGFVPSGHEANMKRMITQVFDKFLHEPTKRLRTISKENDGAATIDAIKTIFEISTEDVDPKKYKKVADEIAHHHHPHPPEGAH